MKATNSLEGLGIRIVFVVSIPIYLLEIVSQSYGKYFIVTHFQVLKKMLFDLFNVCAGDNVVNKGKDSSAEHSSPHLFDGIHQNPNMFSRA
ncbi:MAG: hypothetical protein HDS82_07710 [Bacteroidales bacterium]|nr:hypothetical protein [Bacteroidales bacterium]